MADQNLLREAGRVRCEGAQLLYELVRLNDNHFLKFYNAQGQLKLMRPIAIPPHADEIHPAGASLLLHTSPPSAPTSSQLLLLQFAHLHPTLAPLPCPIPSPIGNQPRIRHLYSNQKLNLIAFADWQHWVYIIRLNQAVPSCRQIYHCDAPLRRIQLSHDQESDLLTLVLENGQSVLLEMDWTTNNLVRDMRDDDLIDYYQDLSQDSAFQVRLTRRREGEEGGEEEGEEVLREREREVYLSINEGKYSCCLSPNPDLLFFTGRNFLLVFDRSSPSFISIFNQIFRVTRLDEVCSQEEEHLMVNSIDPHNTMFRFRADANENVRLEIRLLKDGKWRLIVIPLPISAEGNEQSSFSFLKKNLHKLLLQNGLPPPHWAHKIDHALKQLQILQNSFERQIIQLPEVSTEHLLNLNLQELGYKLLKAGLRHFPKEICRLGRRLKENMLAGANISSLEGHRFFAYCHRILNEFVFELKILARRVEQQAEDGEEDMNVREAVKNISDSLERMIDFLRTLAPPQPYYSRGSGKDVADKAKRIYLSARLLNEEDICGKLRKWQSDVQENLQQDLEVFRTHSKLLQMDYRPRMLHQHFSDKPFPLEANLEFSIVDLLDRQELLEVSYVYQSITRIPSTPYLPADVSDLIENLAFHLPRLLPPEDAREGKYQDLLHKVAATTLRLDYGPFLRYVAQLAVVHQEHALAVLLLQRPAASSDPQFCADTLLLAGQAALAHILVLEHYTPELFKHFLKSAAQTGSLGVISQLRVAKLLHPDAEEIMRNQPTEPLFREILESLDLAYD